MENEKMLSVEGIQVLDEYGNLAHLVGIHKRGFEDHWSGLWIGQASNSLEDIRTAIKANLNAMRSWGANIIRLILSMDWWIDDTPNHRQILKDVCQYAEERGMYVELLPYQVIHYGVAGSTGNPNLPIPPYISTEEQAYIPNEDAFVEYWASMAQELGNRSNLIFCPYGEPRAEKDRWFTLVQRVINRIRQVEDANGYVHHIIYVCWGAGPWCNIDHPSYEEAWLDCSAKFVDDPLLPTGDNVIYGLDFYRFYDSCGLHDDYTKGYTYDECKQAMQEEYIEYAASKVPFMIGEIGANIAWKTQNPAEWEKEKEAFINCLNIFNEWGIHYCGLWWQASGLWALLSSPETSFTPNESGDILRNAFGVVPPELYTCSICGATFSTQAELDAHMASAHPTEPQPPQEGNMGTVIFMVILLALMWYLGGRK
jgi:hypothetical protein